MERIAEIAEETDVPETFDDYFKKDRRIFVTVSVSEKAEADTLKMLLFQSVKKRNAVFYDDIKKAENYGKSYGNPTYAVKLGEE